MNSLLLDTHALLWWANGGRALSGKVRRSIEEAETKVFVSAASAWEIATKVRLGKLEWASAQSVEAYCSGQRFTLLPVSFAHGERAGAWPVSHGDPFDRMLAAQSRIEELPLATNDPKLRLFGIETVW
ncbi:MAG TPA: type II toxin-antitoxin system VapC family toxin [Polyangiaceae bacterium]|nr:type II toxin-antitoxin system VapC family toxin [Polyangiaceae bacterium]